MRASEAVKAGINGLEHISPSVFNDVCPAHLRFGAGTSMAGRQFVERLRAGWLAADFAAPDARIADRRDGRAIRSRWGPR